MTELEKKAEPDLDDEDPYLSIVPDTDDPNTPAFTVLLLGSLWCIILGASYNILQFRTNFFAVDSLLATLVAYPMGLGLAKLLPTTPYRLFGQVMSLNPGPFSIKEHVLITAGAYGIDNVVVQKFHLFIGNDNITFTESLLWVFATQVYTVPQIEFIGFGIAGLSRRFLVKPKAMLWPNILSSVALFVTLHKPDVPSGKWTMSRFKFFWICFVVIFVYSWIPEYFMVTLQAVAWLCFTTRNRTVRFLGSGDMNEGVGLGMLTFDWYYVTSAALTVPFVYMCNYLFGNILYTWIIVPILFYTNAFDSPTYKIIKYPNSSEWRPVVNSVALFNRTGYPIEARSLLNPNTYELDPEKYQANGPIYITEYFAMNYIANFLALSATFSHVGIWYGKTISRQAKEAFKRHQEEQATDIHAKLMSVYTDVPDWAFLLFLVACVTFMSLVVSLTHFHMPVWAVFMGVGITGITLIPLGTIEAITGTRIYLNVLSQMIIGLILPGKTVPVMAYKSLGVNSALQALTLITDLKLGHYMKIPPISMILCQLYGTFLGSITSVSVSWAVMNGMKNVIGTGDWKAIGFRTFYNAAAIWGAIGPQRFFGIGTTYQGLLFGFLIGFFLPFLPWLASKAYPSHAWKYINIPIIVYISGAGSIQSSTLMTFFISFLFQFYIFRYKNDWWRKYNYVMAAAVSGSVALCVLVVSLLKNSGIKAPVWNGNPDIQNDVSLDYYCFDI